MTVYNLNALAGRETSTYGGSLDLDSLGDQVLDSCFECTCSGWEKDKHTKDCMKTLESHYLRDDFDDWQVAEWKKQMDFSMFDFLGKTFKKYGYTMKNPRLYSPKAYNFESDTIDISLEFKGNEKRLLRNLQKEINLYIDKVRTPSCDGYFSMEPSSFEDVDPDDYAVLWAILKREGLVDCVNGEWTAVDDLKDAYDEFIETESRSYGPLLESALYKHCRANQRKGIKSKIIYS